MEATLMTSLLCFNRRTAMKNWKNSSVSVRDVSGCVIYQLSFIRSLWFDTGATGMFFPPAHLWDCTGFNTTYDSSYLKKTTPNIICQVLNSSHKALTSSQSLNKRWTVHQQTHINTFTFVLPLFTETSLILGYIQGDINLIYSDCGFRFLSFCFLRATVQMQFSPFAATMALRWDWITIFRPLLYTLHLKVSQMIVKPYIIQ